jgi:hypothetical protein
MATTTITNPGTSTIASPAFLDGKPKRMLIGNQWVDSASGKTFDSINPAPARYWPLSPRATPRTSTAP